MMGQTSQTAKISVCLQKGGVGKTTLSTHLSGALNQRNHDILAIDTDPQGGLTKALGFKNHYRSNDFNLHHILTDIENQPKINNIIYSHKELDLIPSNNQMVNTESDLVNAPRARKRLDKAIKNIDKNYDYIIIDCPPSLDILTDNALLATKNVLIPTYAEELSRDALELLIKQIESLEEWYETNINILALVTNRVEHNNESKEIMKMFEKYFSDKMPIFKIRKRVALQRSITNNFSIFNHKEKCDMEEELLSIAEYLDNKFSKKSKVKEDV